MMFEFDSLTEQKAKLKVVGVGGAGGNAVTRMITSGMQGVDFIAINTDAQDLDNNPSEQKIQVGKNLTKGLGAGANSSVGKEAVEADKDAINSLLDGADMVFITAGLGGGTGTGAAPVISQISRELGILTVGIVTLPFNFEGPKRMNRALEGMAEMKKACDTLIAIPNQKLMSIVDKSTTLPEAFQMADTILHQAAKGISDLINVQGHINLDFADVETIMKNMGEAIMGTGIASGEERAVLAAQQAISSPLLDNATIKGAQGVLVNITGGEDLTEQKAKLKGEIRVTVIATGFNMPKTIDQIEEKEVSSHESNETPHTRQLQDQSNKPLHEIRNNKSEEEKTDIFPEKKKPVITFDDTTNSSVVYGDDLQIPAFIRRQHE